jgi:hypothetical protein
VRDGFGDVGVGNAECGVLGRIYLAEDKVQWWAFVNTVMDLPIS